MKDITKGDLLELIGALPPCIKNDKYRMASHMLPSIKNWAGGAGVWRYETKDDELEVIINIRRTEKYQNKIIRDNRQS